MPNLVLLVIQWNPYIAETIGELHVGRYRGPAVAEGFYFISTIKMKSGPEFLAVI